MNRKPKSFSTCTQNLDIGNKKQQKKGETYEERKLCLGRSGKEGEQCWRVTRLSGACLEGMGRQLSCPFSS